MAEEQINQPDIAEKELVAGDVHPPIEEEAVQKAVEQELTPAETAKVAFVAAMPEYAAVYDTLDQQTRQGLLVANLAKPTAVTEPNTIVGPTAPEGEKPISQQSQNKSIPTVDVDQIEQEELDILLDLGVDEKVAAKVAKNRANRMGDMVNRMDGLSQLVVTAWDEVRDEAVIPVRWQSAMRVIPGATESDLEIAKTIVKASPNTDMKIALELAVARRASKAQRKHNAPVSSERTQRVIAAIQAGHLAGSGPRGGAPVTALEDTTEARMKLRHQELEEAKKKK